MGPIHPANFGNLLGPLSVQVNGKFKFFFKSKSQLEVKVMGLKIDRDRKVLPQGIHLRTMKALSLLVQNLMQRLCFIKSRSKLEVKVTGSKFLYRSHKEYTCLI